MPTAKLVTLSIFLGGMLLAGCTTSTTLLEDNWGRSVETANFNQRLNPQAPVSNDPVEGMAAKSAINILNGYNSGFTGRKVSSSTGIAESNLD